jgi:hypothetical protein
MTHTQGDWMFSEYNTGDFSVHSTTGDGNDIALVRSKKSKEEALSNVKLITAAPDMLAALQFVKGVLANAPKGHYDGITMRTIDNAIKKATE